MGAAVDIYWEIVRDFAALTGLTLDEAEVELERRAEEAR